MMDVRCETCKYFLKWAGRRQGWCKRRAPIYNHVQDGRAGLYRGEGVWPIVGMNSWCGEHVVEPENLKSKVNSDIEEVRQRY